MLLCQNEGYFCKAKSYSKNDCRRHLWREKRYHQSLNTCSALQRASASISDSLISWRLYVTGQSIQVQFAIGDSRPALRLVDRERAFSFANVPELSKHPLHFWHLDAN